MRIEYTQPTLSLPDETEKSKANKPSPTTESTKQQEQKAAPTVKISYEAEALQLSRLLSAADYGTAQKRIMLQDSR